MKKNILILLAFITGSIYSQQEQKSIELPDFVITGRQSVEVQAAKKKKPDLISILSQEFFTPQYSPEELPLLLSSQPKKLVPSISASEDYYSGRLFIGAGRYILPVGDFSISKSFDNFLLSAGVWGTNTKEYISNAGYNASGANINSTIFIDTDSDILAGTIIKLDGSYWRDNYKFFGSVNPLFERKTNRGNGSLYIKNNYYGVFNFGVKLNADFLTLVESNLQERDLSLSADANFKLGNMTIGGIGKYQKQILNNNLSGKDSYNFYSLDGFIKLSPTSKMNLILGAEIAGNSNNSFFSPFGSLQFALDKGLSVNLNFKPHAENFTVQNFLSENLYMRNGLVDNVMSEVKFDLGGSLNYDYEKLFGLSFWGNYSSTNNYHYFEDSVQKGFFDLKTISGVKSLSAGINLLVHPNLLGYFNGEFKFQDVKDGNSRYIPYTPTYSAKLIYGIDLTSNIGVNFKYTFAHNTYADILNTISLSSYHNISAGVSYNLVENLSLTADFQNILNRSNFAFRGYKEKPFDILFGAEYRW